MTGDELEVARSLAIDAGALIADALGRPSSIDHKSPVNLVTEIDRAAEDLIVSGLRRAFPADVVVAEESTPEAVEARRCWYVDPIDGTTNFVHGLPQCAVSIALAVGAAMEVAVVNDPCKGELFEARRGGGSRLNGQTIGVSTTAELGDSLLVSGFPYDRREHIGFYLAYFEAFMLEAQDVRRLGSAALDLCYVASGRFDGFWEWKLSPWDTAAGWLIVEEAGGVVSDFDGSTYDAWQPRILATNGRIHGQARAVLARLPPSP